MSRRSLLAVVAAASIGLAACGTADTTTDTGTEAGTEASTEASTEAAPTPEATTAPSVEDEGPGTDTVPTTPPVEDEGPGTDTPPAPAADPDADVAVDPVTLAFDGRSVPVATACTGADGAVLATTEGEVTITLVREEGVALRYQAEGTSAETDEVAVQGGTDTTTYTATLSSADVDPVEVSMVVMDDASFALEAC